MQVLYGGAHGGNANFRYEIEALCGALDPLRLFIVAEADSVEKADLIVRHAQEACAARRKRPF